GEVQRSVLTHELQGGLRLEGALLEIGLRARALPLGRGELGGRRGGRLRGVRDGGGDLRSRGGRGARGGAQGERGAPRGGADQQEEQGGPAALPLEGVERRQGRSAVLSDTRALGE